MLAAINLRFLSGVYIYFNLLISLLKTNERKKLQAVAQLRQTFRLSTDGGRWYIAL